MAATSEAILLGNDTQVVALHKDTPPSQYYNDNNESIQDHLDSLINDLSSDWKGSIQFCCHVIYNNDQINKQILKDPPPIIDICEYLGGLMYPVIKLIFSSITYPRPKSICEGGEGGAWPSPGAGRTPSAVTRAIPTLTPTSSADPMTMTAPLQVRVAVGILERSCG